MNPKIKKLRAERSKNEEKIAAIRAKNAVIDKQITELENTDIVGTVRSLGVTLEELAAIIQAAKQNVPIPEPDRREETAYEE